MTPETKEKTTLTEKEQYACELVAYALGERPDCPEPPTEQETE